MRTVRMSTRGVMHWVVLGLFALGGCAIDVDLVSTPSSTMVGTPVDFDISVRNRTTCPVGGVVALLFPFIPKDQFINQIEDEGLRESLSQFVDAFCTGADIEPPDGSGVDCRLVDGEIFCEIDVAEAPGAVAETAVATTSAGDAVTCSSDGQKITCRFPRAMVDMAQQANAAMSPGALQCATGSNIAACAALLLDPNETKSNQVQLIADRPGILRNWIISFATVNEGVCIAGAVRRRPCEEDSDCTGLGNSCGTGICVGGSDEGFGCDSGADCDSGTCDPCEVANDGQVLSGVACTTTIATTTAPAPLVSAWGLLAVVACLLGLGAVTMRRLRGI